MGLGFPNPNSTGEIYPGLCIHVPVIKGRLRAVPCSSSGLQGGEGLDYFRIPGREPVAGMPWVPWVPHAVPGLPPRKPRARRAADPSTGPFSRAGFTSRSQLFWMAGKSELR